MSSPHVNKTHLKLLEEWFRSYEPDQLFDDEGKLRPELQALAPPKELQMGRSPHVNPVMKPLALPDDIAKFSVQILYKRGGTEASDNKVLGRYLAEVFKQNEKTKNFRMFSPDETDSNRLMDVWEATNRQFMGTPSDVDEHTAQYGRVIEVLSEHQCQGLLEGYLLTGGHGILNSYEAFIHIIDSMFNQHAKWLKTIKEVSWRNRLSSLNLLLSSHVWRQDHNGFTHQDPGFLNHVATKKSDIVRIYLPPDGNCLLSVMHHCLSTYNRCNVIVSGKHEAPQWLTIDEAKIHVQNGCGVWEWASNDKGQEPNVVIACAGDVPTLEALAATSILRTKLPGLRVRFINIVDLFVLSDHDCAQGEHGHPHGFSHHLFDSMFTNDKPVVFAFHGYPHLVEKLVYSRHNHNFVVRGYIEEGTITTPFDTTVRNRLDRYHLVMDVCNQIESGKCGANLDDETRWNAVYVRQEMLGKLVKHREHINTEGVEMEEILNWKWEPGMADRAPSFFRNL
jgi:xylulose-5-phosphate/fructose-6-phosphate phosphoketolase